MKVPTSPPVQHASPPTPSPLRPPTTPPRPPTPAAAALNLSFIASTDPHCASIASLSVPSVPPVLEGLHIAFLRGGGGAGGGGGKWQWRHAGAYDGVAGGHAVQCECTAHDWIYRRAPTVDRPAHAQAHAPHPHAPPPIAPTAPTAHAPEEVVVPDAAAVVAHHHRHLGGHLGGAHGGVEVLDAQRRQLGELGQGGVDVGDVGLVVLGVVDRHGHGVHKGLRPGVGGRGGGGGGGTCGRGEFSLQRGRRWRRRRHLDTSTTPSRSDACHSPPERRTHILAPAV